MTMMSMTIIMRVKIKQSKFFEKFQSKKYIILYVFLGIILTLTPFLITKANKMHNFSNLFDKILYMFQTSPLSIIRSISTLYTRNRYLPC